MTGHRTYLDLSADKRRGNVVMIHNRNDALIEAVIKAKKKGIHDDFSVAA
jgi:hypothetical protein